MNPAPQWLHRDGQRVVLTLRVQPRASRTAVAEATAERLRLRIAAPPVDDAANRELIAFLARQFKVPRGRVELLSGATARAKRVAIDAPRRMPEWTDIEKPESP